MKKFDKRFVEGVHYVIDERHCFIWLKAVGNHGYGQVTYQGRTMLAHRVAFTLNRGPIPAGLCVLHTCDNRRCISPDHLFLGTNRDNMRDARMKGRLRGKDPKRVTAVEAELVVYYRTRGLTHKEIAHRLDISTFSVNKYLKLAGLTKQYKPRKTKKADF